MERVGALFAANRLHANDYFVAGGCRADIAHLTSLAPRRLNLTSLCPAPRRSRGCRGSVGGAVKFSRRGSGRREMQYQPPWLRHEVVVCMSRVGRERERPTGSMQTTTSWQEAVALILRISRRSLLRRLNLTSLRSTGASTTGMTTGAALGRGRGDYHFATGCSRPAGLLRPSPVPAVLEPYVTSPSASLV